MANKDFGVKKIELIGSSGTPNLTSPTNLNLNANTVAISTDVTIGGKVQSDVIVGTGYSVGIGSTLPQQSLDVSGTIRATAFVKSDGSAIGGGNIVGLSTTGNSYFTNIDVNNQSSLTNLNVSGVSTFTGGLVDVQSSGVPAVISHWNSSKHLQLSTGDNGGGLNITDVNYFAINHQPYADRGTTNNLTERLRITTAGNAEFAGVVTATSFVGDGSQLTNVGAGTTIQWTLGADGTSNYTFTGPGLTGAENDPTLYLMRGQTYKFINNMGAHPFRIQSDPNGSTGTQYNDGITNNDVSNGTLVWDVQFDAPKILYYQCTAHGNMGGPIYVLGEDEVSPSYTDVNVSGVLTVSQGRIQADAASNLRFGNIAAGSGSGRNIAIGDQVLGSLSSGNGRNIGVGELSLNNVTSGGYNVGLGIKAGQLITNGQYNVVLGGYDGNSGNLDIRGLSNRVVIADGEGNIRQYINNSGRTGINTTVLTDMLTVGGSVTATSYSGSGVGLTGLPAGQLTGALPALDGSALTGVSAVGSGIEVKDNGVAVGAAATVDFSTGLDVTPVSAGVVTITAAIPGISTTGTSGFNNITASGEVTVTGHAQVGGALTVTGAVDFDSTLNVDGNLLLSGNNQIRFGGGQNTFLYLGTDNKSRLQTNNNEFLIGAPTVRLQSYGSVGFPGENFLVATKDGSVDLYYNNALRLQTATNGITVYGDVTLSGSGSQFVGSGAGLTSIPAGELTGTLPAIDGSALLNVNATGDGVVVEDSGSNVGSAKTINFDAGLDVTYGSGIATVTASGGSLQNRTTVSASTTSIADNAVGLVTVTGFKSYALMKVGLSTAGWIRIYTDSESRTADSSRSVGEDPAAGSGVIAEVVTTGISTEQKISPFTMGGNMDDPVDTTIYMAITNLSGSTQSINANLTILQLEA